ncbi:MAG: glycosyltransferase [Bifidobacteriaceae bacterium]|nr:glycosyltransferase [Bifidobacteriaceae bacterium]
MEVIDMKRVLVIGMTDNPGGMESVIMAYYRALDKNRVQCDFLANTSRIAYEDEICGLGGHVYHLPPRHTHPYSFYRALRRFFTDNATKYTAIWENECSLANISYLSYAKRYGISKRIIHCHNSQNGEGFIRGVLHCINRHRIRHIATTFWSCSDKASVWFFGDDFASLPSYRCIPNAIDTERFAFDPSARERIRKRLGLSEQTILVGNVGRFVPQKNQSQLLDIFAHMRQRNHRYSLVLIGQGILADELRKKVEALDLSSSVVFLGTVREVEFYYDAMDLFLFPSLFEGLPVAPIEAQCAGLPIVFSDRCPANANIDTEKNLVIDISESADSLAGEIDSWFSSMPNNRASKVPTSIYSMSAQIDAFTSELIG